MFRQTVSPVWPPMRVTISMVRWAGRDEIDSWAKANASDAAMTITTVDDHGRARTEVITRIGSIWGAMPRAKKPEDEK